MNVPAKGRAVLVTASEPPDDLKDAFGRTRGCHVVLEGEGQSAGKRFDVWLLSVDDAFSYEGALWEYFVLTTRYVGEDFSAVDRGEILLVNAIRTTREQVESAEPLKTKSWKEEQGFIGTIKLADLGDDGNDS